jgi:hypothetical protein
MDRIFHLQYSIYRTVLHADVLLQNDQSNSDFQQSWEAATQQVLSILRKYRNECMVPVLCDIELFFGVPLLCMRILYSGPDLNRTCISFRIRI